MMACTSGCGLLAGGVAGALGLWQRNVGRDRWNALFLSSLLALMTTRMLGLAAAEAFASCVLPMIQLAGRCIHQRKTPTSPELAGYLVGCVLLPAVWSPPGILGRLVTLIGCAYPHLVGPEWPVAAGAAQVLGLVPVLLLQSCNGLFLLLGLNALEPSLFQPAGPGAATSPVARGKREVMTQDMFRKTKLPEEVDAVVIGSGIGGLAAAALMARIQGKKVLVLEKHYRSGGCTHIFDEYGDLFDSGIHYVGAPAMLSAMMALLGDGSFGLSQMGSPADGWLYDQFDLGSPVGGKQFVEFRADRPQIFKELKTLFPDQSDALDVFNKRLKKLSIATYIYVVWSALSGVLEKLVGPALLQFFRRHVGMTAKQAVAECGITDPKLKAVLEGGQLIDWNCAPDEVSFFVSGQMLNYYDDGGFYPTGGSDRIAEAIIPVIEQAGGRVLTQVEVTSIAVEDGKAVGVHTDKAGLIRAPITISDAGAINTFEKLLPESERAQYGLPKLKLTPGRSHMTAFVSLDGVYSEFELRPSNIHSFVGLPEFEFDISSLERALFADPTGMAKKALITLTCPSAKDPLYQDRSGHRRAWGVTGGQVPGLLERASAG